nr:hypothetical protein [Tanacetum cinerariifolium]
MVVREELVRRDHVVEEEVRRMRDPPLVRLDELGELEHTHKRREEEIWMAGLCVE